jgi:hypothetical protein
VKINLGGLLQIACGRKIEDLRQMDGHRLLLKCLAKSLAARGNARPASEYQKPCPIPDTTAWNLAAIGLTYPGTLIEPYNFIPKLSEER